MALVSWQGGLVPGRYFEQWSSIIQASLNAGASDKVAFIVRAPETGTLDSAEFWANLVSTPHDLKISFQDLDPATGFPDGVIDQYRVYTMITAGPSTSEWVIPGLITSNGTNGGTKRSVTRGDLVCVVVEWDSTVGTIQISLGTGATSYSLMDNAVHAAGGAWSHALGTALVALKYSDGTYHCAPAGSISPMTNSAVYSLRTSSSPDEVALRFQLPFDCEIGGARCHLLRQDTGCLYTVILYDENNTILTSRTAKAPDPTHGHHEHFTMFTAAIPLTRNTTYRLSVLPTTTNRLQLYYYDVASTLLMDAQPLGGECYASERTDAGAWTDTTTRRPWIYPWLTAIPDGT